MRRISSGAARHYARALLDVALAQADAGAMRAELEQAAGLLDAHRELRTVLLHPALKAEKRRALVEAVFKDGAPLLRRLLTLLAERGRMELLPAVAAAYAELWNAHRGVAEADVATAVPLAAAEAAQVEAALARAVGQGIEIKASVEPRLLGGVRVRLAGRIYDGTVRGRLQALRARLLGNEGSL